MGSGIRVLVSLTAGIVGLLSMSQVSHAQDVFHEESVGGGSSGAITVATAGSVTAAPGQLYVAAVSSKPDRVVGSVSGLGLDWSPVVGQCAGRSQTGVEVWAAWGSASGDGPVTATLSSAPKNAVIVVSRYSGVDPLAPIGNFVSGNSNGIEGACSGGTDGDAYAFDLVTTAPGSVVYGAAAMRNKTHEPGLGYTEQIEIVQGGSGGSKASLAVQDRPIALPSLVAVDGTFNRNVDWAVAAVEIKASGSSEPEPDIAVSPAAHDYGALLVGASAVKTFDVVNQGTLDLAVDFARVEGPDAVEFQIEEGSGPFALAPGESQAVTVSFAPVALGAKSATLRIASNDPDRPQVDVALSGAGIESPPVGEEVLHEESVGGGSTEAITVATAGSVTAVPGQLYLAAVSSKPDRVVGSVSGLGLAWSPVIGQCAGRSQTGVEVWAAWGSASGDGPVTATLSSAPNSAVIVVSRYSGVDLVEPIGNLVSGNTNGIAGACSDGTDGDAYALDLGTTAAGSVVYGAAAMRNKTHEPGAAYTERIELVHGPSGGSSSSLAVQDRPVAAPTIVAVDGTFSRSVDWAVAALEIKPSGSSQPVPDVAVAPTAHDYGPVLENSSASRSFQIGNDGSADLTVYGLDLMGADPSSFSVAAVALPFTLAPGEARDVVVSFVPTSLGTRSATLRIGSDDPNEDPFDVALTGQGVATLAADIAVAPSSHDYGSVVVGAQSSASFQVHNGGIDDLVVSATTLFGADASAFAIVSGGAPFSVASGESRQLVVSFSPPDEALASAALRISSNDPDESTLDVPLSGSGTVVSSSGGMWISREELALRPMSGPGWDHVMARADGDLGTPEISDLLSKHDVRSLAPALVYARTGDEAYRQKAFDAIMGAMGTDEGATAHAVGRNLFCYIVAADLIDLAAYDPAAEAAFRSWIDALRFVERADGTLIGEDEERANNHGRYAGATRVAIAVYLEDQAEIERAALVFRGLLGDRDAYADFKWTRSLSWQADPDQPVGINPLGAMRDGYSIDGVLTEELRRGCDFQFPPCYTQYPWEGLQGILAEAVLLSRRGYDVYNWSDRAILRAVQFLYDLSVDYPQDPWWAVGDDTFIPWLINAVYGSDFPTDPVELGDIMSYTDWTHGP
jgi:hypothetical protein